MNVSSSYPTDTNSYFNNLGEEFNRYHSNSLNVLLHFVTTPLGVFGFFSMLRSYTKSSSLLASTVLVYLLTLLPVLPSGEFVGTVLILSIILLASRAIKVPFLVSFVLIIAGYLLQDLAHLGTGEATFQSSYSAGGQIDLEHPIYWLLSFLEHCYYLVPLCVHAALPHLLVPASVRPLLAAPLPSSLMQLHVFGGLLLPLLSCALGSYCLDSKNTFCFFPGAPYFYRICQCSLLSTSPIDDEPGKTHESRKGDLAEIRQWTMSQDPPETTSSHWWYSDLPNAPRHAFDRVANASQIVKMFRTLFSEKNYCLEVVEGMNEIYVSSPQREEEAMNSDHVFFARHVDGPFGFIPFVSVYRCIVGLDKNMKYITNFPIAHMGVNACEGDVLAFDYNREVHHIVLDESKKEMSDKFRVTLKLHYCIYPRVLAPLGWLMKYINIKYNQSFRALFLKTINPQSLYEHFLAWNVNFNTFLFDRLETHIGWRNVIYLTLAAALWYITGSYELFMSVTSFVHYFR